MVETTSIPIQEKTPLSKKKLIELKDVIKIYRRDKIDVPALRNISCSFYTGEICVVMGPSGCGKTTLLNVICGITQANSGYITIKDSIKLHELEEGAREEFRRGKVSYIFQTQNLIPYLTCYENILFPVLVSGVKVKTLDSQHISELIQLVGLENRKNHYPAELSGGEQQRTCIAAALLKNSEIILGDEITGELDSKSKIQIMKLLKSIIEKYPQKTIIIVTHDHDFKGIADRVYFIRDGRIVYQLLDADLAPYREKWGKIAGEEESSLMDISEDVYNDDLVAQLEELKYDLSTRISALKQKKAK